MGAIPVGSLKRSGMQMDVTAPASPKRSSMQMVGIASPQSVELAPEDGQFGVGYTGWKGSPSGSIVEAPTA
jgi:hypothetical protein